MPENLSPLQFSLATVILILAYTVRGITGFGSGLIAIPLLALMMPLPLVVPMVVLLDYLASASHGIKNRGVIQWREILPLLPFTLSGVITALYLFNTIETRLLVKALAVFIILFALYNLLSPSPPHKGSRLWAIAAGGLGGLIGTLFGTGGPFYVIYLQLRKLEKTPFRATLASIFLLDGGTRLVGYTASGFFNRETLLLLLAALPVMAFSLYLGGHIHTNLSQKTFQKAISILLLGSGTALLIK